MHARCLLRVAGTPAAIAGSVGRHAPGIRCGDAPDAMATCLPLRPRSSLSLSLSLCSTCVCSSQVSMPTHSTPTSTSAGATGGSASVSVRTAPKWDRNNPRFTHSRGLPPRCHGDPLFPATVEPFSAMQVAATATSIATNGQPPCPPVRCPCEPPPPTLRVCVPPLTVTVIGQRVLRRVRQAVVQVPAVGAYSRRWN